MSAHKHFMVTVFSEDQQGLIAAISRALFELDINLGDASYSVLGEGGKFVALCAAPAALDAEQIQQALAATPVLADAQVQVEPFGLALHHQRRGQALELAFSGQDMPGLVAQVTELAQDFSANIEQMNTRSLQGSGGDHYRIELRLAVPAQRREALLAAMQNVASSLGLSFESPLEAAA